MSYFSTKTLTVTDRKKKKIIAFLILRCEILEFLNRKKKVSENTTEVSSIMSLNHHHSIRHRSISKPFSFLKFGHLKFCYKCVLFFFVYAKLLKRCSKENASSYKEPFLLNIFESSVLLLHIF